MDTRMRIARVWLAIAGVLGASGVGLGAYASHGLGFIADAAAREAARNTLQLAVQQHMLHALALVGIAALAARWHSRALCIAGVLMVLGTVLFSGLIYLRILAGVEALRPLVPWGGTCLIAGWLALVVAACTARSNLNASQ